MPLGMVAGIHSPLCPGIEIIQPKSDGQKKECHERQGSRAGLDNSSNKKSPCPTGQMINHQQHHRPQGEPQKKQVGWQVGPKEWRWIADGHHQ